MTKEARARYGAGAKKRLIDFYTGIVQRIEDDSVKESITSLVHRRIRRAQWSKLR